MKELLSEEFLRLQKLAGITTESKQVGLLYHFTKVATLKKILTSGLMFAENNEFDGYYDPDNEDAEIPVDPKKKYAISVTRSPNFGGSDPWGYKKQGCRLVLDGDRISQKYKIAPINVNNTWMGQAGAKKGEYLNTKFDKFFEERIYSPTPGYLPLDYIKQIDIIHTQWDKLSPKNLEAIKNLNTANISINRVEKF